MAIGQRVVYEQSIQYWLMAAGQTTTPVAPPHIVSVSCDGLAASDRRSSAEPALCNLTSWATSSIDGLQASNGQQGRIALAGHQGISQCVSAHCAPSSSSPGGSTGTITAGKLSSGGRLGRNFDDAFETSPEAGAAGRACLYALAHVERQKQACGCHPSPHVISPLHLCRLPSEQHNVTDATQASLATGSLRFPFPVRWPLLPLLPPAQLAPASLVLALVWLWK